MMLKLEAHRGGTSLYLENGEVVQTFCDSCGHPLGLPFYLNPANKRMVCSSCALDTSRIEKVEITRLISNASKEVVQYVKIISVL